MISNISCLLPKYNSQKVENKNCKSCLDFNDRSLSTQDSFVSSQKNSNTKNISFGAKVGENNFFEKVGTAVIKDIKNRKKEVNASIVSKMDGPDKIFCVEYQGKKIGKMVISYYDEDNGIYTHTKNFKHVYINEIITKCDGNKFRDVGNSLMQAAVEESIKIGGEGKVELSAYKHGSYKAPEPYYFKLGFRALDDSINQKLSELLKKDKNADFSGDGSIYMYLPQNAISEFKAKIKKRRVLD